MTDRLTKSALGVNVFDGCVIFNLQIESVNTVTFHQLMLMLNYIPNVIVPLSLLYLLYSGYADVSPYVRVGTW